MSKLSDKERIRKKAEEYGNSRPLDVWKVSDHPEVKAAIHHIFSEMESAGETHRVNEKRLKDHIRVIVLDLFVAHKTDPEMYISYSRNANAYEQGTRYNSLFLGYRNVIRTTNFLIEERYVDHVTGRYVRDGSGRRSYQSRMRATNNLISLVQDQHEVELPMIKRDEDEEIIVLRDTNKVNIGYMDTPEIIQMRENLKLINSSLEKNAIALYIWDEDLKILNERLGRDPKRRPIDFTDKRLRRVFNNGSFQQGGRFYGGWWQNIPKECRKYIRYNYKDVVELDYSGFHINMLYAKEGLSMPEGDVYCLDGYSNDDIFREFVKRMLLVMVNSLNRSKARGALHEEVHLKKTLELPVEVNSTGGEDLYPLMDAFELKHAKIKHYFCTGVGIDLQYLDSQIAEKVLLNYAKRGRAILPLHDSFIIHHGLEKELKEAMEKAFFDIFGVSTKVDLKYNTIDERRKEEDEYEKKDAENDSEFSPTPLRELLAREDMYGKYNQVLDEYEKYKSDYDKRYYRILKTLKERYPNEIE